MVGLMNCGEVLCCMLGVSVKSGEEEVVVARVQDVV